MKKEKIVGILGGMGPEATIDLMERIVRHTVAEDDCDHIRCIVDNNPKVPSRIQAILEGSGENPGPCLADMGKRLEHYGADFLVIACNTAHYYYDDVQSAVSIPVFNMIDIAIDAVVAQKPAIQKVGILATPMVKKTELYESKLIARGLIPLYPDEDNQARLFEVIRAVKRGDTGTCVAKSAIDVVQSMQQRGAELCIAGCTELGVILAYNEMIVDAADALARAIVANVK